MNVSRVFLFLKIYIYIYVPERKFLDQPEMLDLSEASKGTRPKPLPAKKM